jgi:hypothetical protein
MSAETIAPPPLAYLTPAQLAKKLPRQRSRRPVHVRTVARWILTGTMLSNGTRLRLKAVRTPGGWLSTELWLGEFLNLLAEDRIGEDPSPYTAPRSTAGRRRELERVNRELDKSGL